MVNATHGAVDAGVRTKSAQSRLRLASATDLPATVESVDMQRKCFSASEHISSRACRVPAGQSSQCSSVCGAWTHPCAAGVHCVVHQMFVCLKTDTAAAAGGVCVGD